ncbi:hypothetical protein FSP39_015064 [Pinctada imbricata]|uniref:Uncharacterized protein n=1 Tax=Pinctada imbricata TaxID=66713 RepID=A0AA88YHI5_PINIB|nr:hypothetical protein FSP39_015064 [Pinctada imbricata]
MICIIKYLAKMNGYEYIGLENDGDIWSVVNELREGKVQHQVDVAIINKIVNYLGSLNNICDKMKILHSKMHILQLMGFLETVSYFSFFGVQMVKAESERLELTMCLLTTFSITMLCFIVADIDNPFHGFFRIDLTVIGDILMMLEEAYYSQVHIKSPVQQITKKETPGK